MLLLTQACICACGALLNILLPVLRSRGGISEVSLDPLCSLLSSAIVLSMAQHSLQDDPRLHPKTSENR